MGKTYEYFCSGCGLLRSKNEEGLSGNCPRCDTWYARLIPVEWEKDWVTYWDLEEYYIGKFKREHPEKYWVHSSEQTITEAVEE